MRDISARLHGLCPHLQATTVAHLSRIIGAMWAMTGRVTMLGIARWAGTGGSYRTVPRFLYTVIPWPVLLWVFVRQHVLDPTDTYL
jgi:putative transposase